MVNNNMKKIQNWLCLVIVLLFFDTSVIAQKEVVFNLADFSISLGVGIILVNQKNFFIDSNFTVATIPYPQVSSADNSAAAETSNKE